VGLLHILCFLSAGDLPIQVFGHACFFALWGQIDSLVKGEEAPSDLELHIVTCT
jgi:hypothetical protein